MTQQHPDADKPIRTAITDEDGIDFAIIELLFFAYRDFTSDPDQILADYGCISSIAGLALPSPSCWTC